MWTNTCLKVIKKRTKKEKKYSEDLLFELFVHYPSLKSSDSLCNASSVLSNSFNFDSINWSRIFLNLKRKNKTLGWRSLIILIEERNNWKIKNIKNLLKKHGVWMILDALDLLNFYMDLMLEEFLLKLIMITKTKNY